MRTVTCTSWDFAIRPTLYRIWVPLRDDGAVPLVSIWIDPTLAAFKPCAREASCGLDSTVNSLEGQEKIPWTNMIQKS
jgi:hypothetical protein